MNIDTTHGNFLEIGIPHQVSPARYFASATEEERLELSTYLEFATAGDALDYIKSGVRCHQGGAVANIILKALDEAGQGICFIYGKAARVDESGNFYISEIGGFGATAWGAKNDAEDNGYDSVSTYGPPHIYLISKEYYDVIEEEGDSFPFCVDDLALAHTRDARYVQVIECDSALGL